jgi:hypothetical protein
MGLRANAAFGKIARLFRNWGFDGGIRDDAMMVIVGIAVPKVDCPPFQFFHPIMS